MIWNHMCSQVIHAHFGTQKRLTHLFQKCYLIVYNCNFVKYNCILYILTTFLGFLLVIWLRVLLYRVLIVRRFQLVCV